MKKLTPKNHGGKRDGSGRKPDWLKEKCAKLVDVNKLMEFVSNVASGEETEIHYDKMGHAFEASCSTKDRLHAVEILLERGFGKPVQGVELSGKEGAPAVFDVVIKVAER